MRYLYFILILLSTSVASAAIDVKTYIPPKALPLLPVVADEIDILHAGFEPGFMASAIEKESCISLTHSKCWSPTSKLLTYWDSKKKQRREHGQGLGQFTRTWNRDGSVRFDTLTRLTDTYKTRLNGLNWTTIENRPDLQIRAMALLMWETYGKLPTITDNQERQAMTVSAYNSGQGRLNSDRRTCGLKRGCDPDKWFNNIESIKTPGYATRVLYGKRTAWDINRGHVKEVIKLRKPKYDRWFSEHKQ